MLLTQHASMLAFQANSTTRDDKDKNFVYKGQRAVQCNIINYNDDLFPLAHSIPIHKPGKPGKPGKSRKPSQSDSLLRKKHKTNQKRQRRAASDSNSNSDGNSDDELAHPRHKANQKRRRRVVRGSDDEEENDDYEDDKDDEDVNATSTTTAMPLVPSVRSSKLSKQNKPYVATIVIPPSQTALEYRLPLGVRKITVGELRDLFDRSKSEPVHYTTIHRDNKCESSLDNLYYDLAFNRLVRILTFQWLKMEIPELTPFHHLLDVPSHVRQSVLNVQGCFGGVAAVNVGRVPTVRLSFWCRSCKTSHFRHTQPVSVIGMAIATTKDEFDYWQSRDTEVSHLCHWSQCANVAHVRKKASQLNNNRNVCTKRLKKLCSSEVSTLIVVLMQRVRQQYSRVDDSKCFPLDSTPFRTFEKTITDTEQRLSAAVV
jgi:hypothetical protein